MFYNPTTTKVVDDSTLRLLFPDTSFPVDINPESLQNTGFYLIVISTPIDIPPGYKLSDIVSYNIVDNKAEASWELVALTPQDTLIKRERDITILISLVQARLDSFAKERGYDGILSATTYADSVVPKFSQEGLKCKELRDRTWNMCYQLLESYTNGSVPWPTDLNTVIPQLPALVW